MTLLGDLILLARIPLWRCWSSFGFRQTIIGSLTESRIPRFVLHLFKGLGIGVALQAVLSAPVGWLCFGRCRGNTIIDQYASGNDCEDQGKR